MTDWLDKLKKYLPAPKQPATTGGLIASTQRSALGVTKIDLRPGVVTLRTGEARCFLRVTGFTVHHRSEADAYAWLQGYAQALNTLPGNAVLISRSRPGGLGAHVRALQAVQAATLAHAANGTALTPLVRDQLALARQAHESGETRETAQYVALHSPKGDQGRLLAAAASAVRHLAAAGVAAEPVTDRALAAALADDWNPKVPPDFTLEFTFPADSRSLLGTLRYAPKDTHVSGRGERAK
jgi:hypothetical protein